jgi:hypothetical protein
LNNLPIQQSLTLVNEMARLSLKADAQRYFFGYLWWILEPLLWVGVFYLVFEVLLGTGRADLYKMIGIGWCNRLDDGLIAEEVLAEALAGGMFHFSHFC